MRQKDKANRGGTRKSSRKCDEAYKEFGDGPEGPRGGYQDLSSRISLDRREVGLWVHVG